jgi:hypothetical protein
MTRDKSDLSSERAPDEDKDEKAQDWDRKLQNVVLSRRNGLDTKTNELTDS